MKITESRLRQIIKETLLQVEYEKKLAALDHEISSMGLSESQVLVVRSLRVKALNEDFMNKAKRFAKGAALAGAIGSSVVGGGYAIHKQNQEQEATDAKKVADFLKHLNKMSEKDVDDMASSVLSEFQLGDGTSSWSNDKILKTMQSLMNRYGGPKETVAAHIRSHPDWFYVNDAGQLAFKGDIR